MTIAHSNLGEIAAHDNVVVVRHHALETYHTSTIVIILIHQMQKPRIQSLIDTNPSQGPRSPPSVIVHSATILEVVDLK